MRRILAIIFATIAWFAVIVQFVLMMQNRIASTAETVIRFFSFFTILTNLLVAVYFTFQGFKKTTSLKPGRLTTITLYILVVGIVYQLLLRHLWQPQGMQRVVDELLHSVTPLLTLIYWYYFEDKASLRYKQIGGWLLYPLIYLFYILFRGSYSGFYPYPFVNVTELGLINVLLNSTGLLIFFVLLAGLLIMAGKFFEKKHG